jgi:GAF domain-containing protein
VALLFGPASPGGRDLGTAGTVGVVKVRALMVRLVRELGVGLVAQGLPLAEELSAVFARMSGLLLSEETVGTAVGLVTALATDAITGAVGAGVTLVDERGAKTTSGASDPVVEKADSAQYELDEGPCVAAWAQRALVRIDDIGSDGRWPRWSRAVEPLGLRAALSAPLVAGDRSLGAVKVYARLPGAFDWHAEHLLVMFAAQAAILLANVQSVDSARRLSDGLKDALHSRDLIATAKGILMARDGIAEELALAVLMADAQRQHQTLREAARVLVRSTVRRGH